MLRKTASVALIALLAGCATQEVQLYEPIDISNKTVMVQPGSEGLKGKLKQALAKDGWKLVVYRGPSITEGEIGEKTKLEHYDTFNARYRLLATSSQLDVCFKGFTPEIQYDISLIDNNSGSEVFTINGRGCEPDVVDKFMNTLRGSNK
jgi:hypothetical protein